MQQNRKQEKSLGLSRGYVPNAGLSVSASIHADNYGQFSSSKDYRDENEQTEDFVERGMFDTEDEE